jgi:hypothetical protein
VLTDAGEFNRQVIEEFRANEGRVGGELAGATLVLVHHVGARTGTVRVDLWPQLLTGSPALRDFDARTAREIPAFVLTPL